MAAGVLERCLVIGVVGAMFVVQEVWGQGSPPAVIELVAFVGDPAPGIPGATFAVLGTPQIEAEGNVLFRASLVGPGITSANHVAVFYGPPGNLEKVLWAGEQAPDMPEGVVLWNLVYSSEYLSETGWIATAPPLAGPGIVPGVNDRVLLCGPPGDLRKVFQGGDPAPGFEEGVYINGAEAFVGFLSDNATLLATAKVIGGSGRATPDRVFWTGTRDELHVAFRAGVAAPGCEEGVVFLMATSVVHNDAGEIAVGAVLEGPGVLPQNNRGLWLGGPGDLTKIARTGDPVPGLAEGVTWKVVAGGLSRINGVSDTAEAGNVQGPGITEANQRVLFAGDRAGIHLVRQAGDPAPEIGPGVSVWLPGSYQINKRSELLYTVFYTGEGITEDNWSGAYWGPFDAPRLIMRDGDPAPGFSGDVTIRRACGPAYSGALNDVGDIVAPTEIAGPGITAENKVVLWLWHRVLQRWVPLLRSGDELDGRTIYAEDEGEMGYWYCSPTGGSDGQRQSFNDLGMLVTRVEFTDGTHGIYRISPPVFGDGDGDGDADEDDWALLLDCWTGPAGSVTPECVVFDLDLDGDVDLIDQQMFEQLRGSQ
jgi:hypothetical protein